MENLPSNPSGSEDVVNFVFTTEVQPWRKHLKDFARQNRRQPTEAEAVLWQALRNASLGTRFRRQHAIAGYIVDFFCTRAFLTIELEGKIHGTPEQAEYDTGRTFTLTELGYRELRFTNQQVLNHLAEVLTDIQKNIQTLNPPSESSGSPLSAGEGAGG